MRILVPMPVLSGIPLAATPLQEPPAAQTSAANMPAFEVVSVRANRSTAEGQSMRLQPGGRAVITNMPLRPLILTAYGLFPQQLAGGPAWIDSERFDVVAQASGNLPPSPPSGPPGPAQLMLQRLLAERFGLRVHIETRELEIYALVTVRDKGRLGPRMTPAKVDCAALMMAAYGRGETWLPPRSECDLSGGPGRVRARGASLQMFARTMLATAADRIVEDRTGLTGSFDFDLEYAVEPGAALENRGRDGASLFTAIEEQLGLKLLSVRAAVDVLVIDSAQRPTEN